MAGLEQVQDLVRRVGSAMACYVCGIDDQDRKEIDATCERLLRQGGSALERLIALVEQARVGAALQGVPFILAMAQISRATNGRSIFNEWRREARSEVPNLSSGDPVVDALAEIAIDIFPLLLAIPAIQTDQGFPGTLFLVTNPVFGSSEHRRFNAAVLADSAFNGFFPERTVDPLQTTSRWFMTSTGRGSSIQVALLAATIIQSAYGWMRLRSHLDSESFGSCLRDVVEVLRSAVAGENVSVPAYVGFNNIALPEGTAMSTVAGVLRTYPHGDDEFIPPEARASTLGGTSTRLGFVLESRFPFSLAMGDPPQQGVVVRPPRLYTTGNDRLNRLVDLVALGFALSVERTPPVGCKRVWTAIADPLFGGVPISWSLAPSVAPVSFHEANQSELSAVSSWLMTLESSDDREIKIAHRRIISALTERADPVDGFVDAVIAWENLFGSREGELSFRISSAIAKLLESDTDARMARQKALRDQYNLRSGIVHGGRHLSGGDAVRERDSALATAVAALRKLHEDWPDLVADSDRARKILLS